MRIDSGVRRVLVVVAAAAGLSALGAGSASADGSPAAPPGDAPSTSTGTPMTTPDRVSTGTRTVAETTNGVRRVLGTAGNNEIAGNTEIAGNAGDIAEYGDRTGEGVRGDAGKAVRHVTQEAGAAVSETRSTPAYPDLGALSGVASQAAPSSAPGLPEDLVIEVPQIVPGVPSIGIIPLSLPQLPVTPGIPAP